MGLKKFFIFCFILLAFIFALKTVNAMQPLEPRNVQVSEIILKDLDGKQVNIDTLSKPAILFFWTTWCPHCRRELKTLNQLYPQMKKEGITLFAVDVGESGSTVQMFLKNNNLVLDVLLDSDSAAAEHYNVSGVPTYVFFTKTGLPVNNMHILPENYKEILFKKNE